MTDEDTREGDEALTPEDYPIRCDAPAEELEVMRERFLDDDDRFGKYVDNEWPPRDKQGNVYPIFFTRDDLTDGMLRDTYGRTYSPFSGNLEPIMREDLGACNAPLNNWRERYPQIRLCGRPTNMKGGEYDYCSRHKGRDNLKSAEEVMQTGLYAQSVDHVYEGLGPWKKLVGWGTFESLLGESKYEFAPEYEERTLDFSDEVFHPDGVDEEGILEVKFGYPTDHVDRALSLFVAAMKTVQMITVQPKIMEESLEEGTGMMETKSVDKAQLTSPTETDPTQEFRTIETWNEHHLNLPFSRLVKDRPHLLEYGGVVTDPDSEAGDEVNSDEIVLDIYADADEVETAEGGTDPNSFENYESPSEEIIEKAKDDT